MKEQRRHQRIRFNVPPLVRLGQSGASGLGRLENLSLGGLMVRTEVSLQPGEPFGCEFSICGSIMIDLSAVVVSRVGELFCARWQPGPVSERLLAEVIARALSSGNGSVLTVNEFQGRRVMRVAGGLNASLHNDFMHGLTKVGVDEIDLSCVTDMDVAGAELCRIAGQTHRVGRIVRPALQIDETLVALAGWKAA